jgi:NADH dehydrogenase [ubiquinone] 1 alpha subcomplex assembly factor 7
MRQVGLEPEVHLVEASPALRAIQQDMLPQARFHTDLASVPADGPMLLMANEFLDALPVRQLVKAAAGWREVVVALDEKGDFALAAGDRPMDAAVTGERRDMEEGTVIETCPAAATVTAEVANRLVRQGGAALFIDYGHAAPRTGSTLQAIRAHAKVDPMALPGEADLTAHDDFATLAELARSRGARWLGTVEQGAWLRAIGLDARAEALARAAPDRHEAIGRAVERLAGAEQMGTLFKVMALAAPGWPDGAGFAA